MTTARAMRMALASALILLAAACNRHPAPDTAKPGSYKVQIPVEPAQGGDLQKLALPAQALVAIQRRDLADVRVFDGAGRALPASLLSRADLARATEAATAVPAYPIVGSAGALKLAGVALRLDEHNRAHIVGIGGADDTAASASPVTAGTLLDTRAVKARAVAIVLDATIPRRQPVAFDLETSTDLKDWTHLATTVMFRPGESIAVLGSQRIDFSPADLKDHYVRIGWSAQTPLLSPVSIEGAKVVTSSAPPVADVAVQASSPRRIDARDWRFDLPFASGLAALRIIESGNDGIVPVRLYGRDAAEAAWTEIGSGVIRPGEPGAFDNRIALGSAGYAHLRILADTRTAGFAQAPKLDLLLRPVDLAVTFDGAPPYTLAAGLASAPRTYLTAQEISGADEPLDATALPVAEAKASTQIVNVTPPPEPGPFSGRRAILWLVLGLGVIGLGFAAFKLLRETPPPD